MVQSRQRARLGQALFALILGCTCTPCRSAPVAQECATEGIAVSAETLDDTARACGAAAMADRHLRRLGLTLLAPVRIEVTEEFDVAPGICVALYSTAERKLQVLPVDCLDDQPGRARAFPEIPAGLLFESLILHELTHAYLDQAATPLFLPRLAHEYLAYAVQLDALPEQDRRRILAKAAISNPVRLSELNEAMLNLSPLRFAAMAWIHFTREGGDAELVQRILNGGMSFHSLRE